MTTLSRPRWPAKFRNVSLPRTRVPHTPEFPVKSVGVADLMRLSLMKGAHAVLSRAAYRKIGYLARFWRDVGIDCSQTRTSQAQTAFSRQHSLIPTSRQNRGEIWGTRGFSVRKTRLLEFRHCEMSLLRFRAGSGRRFARKQRSGLHSPPS